MELFSLKNKTAIVTGACGLIGKEHCRALAEAGANVVAADINEKACKEFAATLGSNHLGLAINVTDKSSLEAGRDMILDMYGTIDILINNAAINDMFENPAMAATQSMFENYPLDMWQKSLDVNVTGVFLCSQVFGTVMAEQGKGSIINVASTYGVVGPDQSIYQNEKGDWGYSLAVWQAGQYHMLSVSHINSVPSLQEIATALESPSAHTSDSGNYRNRRGSLGYYATVRSGDHQIRTLPSSGPC